MTTSATLRLSMIAHVAEHVGFCLSLLVNSTLIFLIVKKSRKDLGSYRFLMMGFASFGIFYSAVDLLTQPIIHVHGSTFVVITVLDTFGLSKLAGSLLCCIYCSCFGMTIVLLAIHFIYRYCAVCKPMAMCYFRGKWFWFWGLIIAAFGLDWGITVFVCEPETDESNDYLRETIKEHYNLEMNEIAYVGPQYFFNNENGKSYNWRSCIGILNLFKIIVKKLEDFESIAFGTVFFCGLSTYRKMQEQRSAATRKTRDLQNQLFKALVVQTLVPIAFMFTPVSTLFMAPFFGVELGTLGNWVSVSLALYPVLDPVVVIYFVRDYRNCISGWLWMFLPKVVRDAVPSSTPISDVQVSYVAKNNVINKPR